MKRAASVLALAALPLAAPGQPALEALRSPAELRIEAGREIFRGYCVGCHGLAAAGCGTSARLYNPRPANLTASTRDDEYKRRIVRNGGEALGRSQFMPPWVGQLDDEEIASVVAYIGSLAPIPTPAC